MIDFSSVTDTTPLDEEGKTSPWFVGSTAAIQRSRPIVVSSRWLAEPSAVVVLTVMATRAARYDAAPPLLAQPVSELSAVLDSKPYQRVGLVCVKKPAGAASRQADTT